MNKIPFENGTLITPAKVNEDNTITPAIYEGTTPLTAHNLNLLQDNIESEMINSGVVVNSTEPTDDRKRVWLQKSKNLLNPTISYLGDYTYSNGVYTLKSGNHIYLMCGNLTVGKSYTVSYKNLNGFNQVRVNDYNYGNSFIEYGRSTETSGTITFIATTSTVIVAFLSGNAGSTIEDVQLELGSTATNYEEYIDKKIYVKKSNDVYEEFINAENNILTANLIYNTTVTSTDEHNLKLHSVFKLSNNLNINEDGNIVIGKNINNIKISANCIYVALSNGIKQIQIKKNNIQLAVTYKSSIAGETDVLVVPSLLVTNVKEGDIISFVFTGATNDVVGGQHSSGGATYITVEAV